MSGNAKLPIIRGMPHDATERAIRVWLKLTMRPGLCN